MKISLNTLNKSLEYFNLYGKISPTYIMRKCGVSFKMAEAICEEVNRIKEIK